jgi:hypothetical protein
LYCSGECSRYNTILILVGWSPVRRMVNPSMAGFCGPGARGHYMNAISNAPPEVGHRGIPPKCSRRGKVHDPVPVLPPSSEPSWKTFVAAPCPLPVGVLAVFAGIRAGFCCSHQHTSSNRPSILNCQAGIPSPVSKLTLTSAPSAPACHTCPDTV